HGFGLRDRVERRAREGSRVPFHSEEGVVMLAFEANEMTEWGSIVLGRREIYMLSIHCHAR
ncbi:unnamed protein product, partial [Musa banksii]